MPSKGQKHSSESRKRIARGTRYGQAKRRALARVAPGELLELERTGTIVDSLRPVASLSVAEAAGLVQAMGGEDRVSEPRMVLIHDLARAGLLLRAVMMRIAQSPDLDLDAVSKASNLINTRRSLLQVLGLDRVERDVPDRGSYIADREVETVGGTNAVSPHEHP